MSAKLLHSVRIGFALLALTAILIQLNRHMNYGFNTVNFFSYFTNLSNILFAIFLLAAGLIGLFGKKHSYLFEVVRGALVLCMLVVGVVFSLLLRGEDLGTLLPWVNVVVHYVMPIVALSDWLLVPPSVQLSRKHVLAWLGFPLLYITYTLIRGSHIGWYPYPFLNPDIAGGYPGVTAYCVGIFVLFLVGGWVVFRTSRPEPRRKPA